MDVVVVGIVVAVLQDPRADAEIERHHERRLAHEDRRVPEDVGVHVQAVVVAAAGLVAEAELQRHGPAEIELGREAGRRPEHDSEAEGVIGPSRHGDQEEGQDEDESTHGAPSSKRFANRMMHDFRCLG